MTRVAIFVAYLLLMGVCCVGHTDARLWYRTRFHPPTTHDYWLAHDPDSDTDTVDVVSAEEEAPDTDPTDVQEKPNRPRALALTVPGPGGVVRRSRMQPPKMQRQRELRELYEKIAERFPFVARQGLERQADNGADLDDLFSMTIFGQPRS